MQQITNFDSAIKFLNSFIGPSTKMRYAGELGLERSKYFMKALGDPQEKIKVIHIAGTSGKGSTCYLIAGILTSLGFKTGLHLSPYIEDFRERFEINNELISKKDFVYYLNQILPAIENVQNKFGFISYFEILTGLAYFIFEKEKVDYAVIETGLGGLLDATNVVQNKSKVSVLTPIGLDHTEILGETISEIASQKAGIIHEGNIVISSEQNKRAENVFIQKANQQNSRIIFIKKNQNFNRIKITEDYSQFDFNFSNVSIDNINLGLLGLHQVANASLALATVIEISKRDMFDVNSDKIVSFLRRASFKARFEIREFKNKKIIIDGAHNPQKMRSFIRSLKTIFKNQKFVFLISFKKGKDYSEMLKIILPLCEKVIVTSFILSKQDMIRTSEDSAIIKNKVKKLGFENVEVINNAEEAFEYVKNTGETNVVITGSLYFIGSIYQFI